MPEEQPKVSVILPSYNVEDYIEECMESVINQTLEDIEIICVDAGSEDNTLEILKKYAQEDSRINVFLSSKKSYGSQVNQGLANATGEYISIIETDDYVTREMLESLYNLSQFSLMDIVKGNFYHMYENEEGRKLNVDSAKRNLKQETPFRVIDEPLFLEGHPSIWSAIYKRSFLANNNITFLEEDGGAWVDNPFFYETALKAENILYTHVPYYYYRQTNENSSSNNLQDLSIPARRINDLFKILDENKEESNEIRQMLYRRLFRYIEITMENNDNSTDNLDYETCKALNEALSNVDEDYVHKKLSNNHKRYYYKFRSPLILYQFKKQLKE